MGGTAAASPLVPVPLLTPLERQTNGFPSSSYSNVTFFFFFFSKDQNRSQYVSEATTVSGIIIRLSALL